MYRVGIVGASGYTGAELLRLCFEHPQLELVWAMGETQAGTEVADLYPSLAAAYPRMRFEPYDASLADGLDLVFLALPHGMSQQLAPDLQRRADKVIDLSADFRLRDAALYPRWYGEEHAAPELLGTFVYGLQELFRYEVQKAEAVAVPGCYPTAAGLALAPLLVTRAVEGEEVIIDAASGISGAGRSLTHATHFGTANEDFTAYGLLSHRHTPEIEQVLSTRVLFTPHLAPMTRGILATCYAKPREVSSTTQLIDALGDFYINEPFIVVSDRPPSTKATLGSNSAHLTARYDERTGWVIVLCAIDNLMKGAAGQAIQCANLMLGLDETTGLAQAAVYP